MEEYSHPTESSLLIPTSLNETVNIWSHNLEYNFVQSTNLKLCSHHVWPIRAILEFKASFLGMVLTVWKSISISELSLLSIDNAMLVRQLLVLFGRTTELTLSLEVWNEQDGLITNTRSTYHQKCKPDDEAHMCSKQIHDCPHWLPPYCISHSHSTKCP